MSKSELIQTIADQHSGTLTRKDVKGIIESLASVGYKELKKSGSFVLPGFAKFVVVKKPATKARKGINQSVHQRTDDLQGQARPQAHQGSPGEGRQGRGLGAFPASSSTCASERLGEALAGARRFSRRRPGRLSTKPRPPTH